MIRKKIKILENKRKFFGNNKTNTYCSQSNLKIKLRKSEILKTNYFEYVEQADFRKNYRRSI